MGSWTVTANVDDLNAFMAAAKSRGFREVGRALEVTPRPLRDRPAARNEARVRLLYRTARSDTPTEAGTRLVERLAPALGEVEAALNSVNDLRNTPGVRLRLNVPVSAAWLIPPLLLPCSLT